MYIFGKIAEIGDYLERRFLQMKIIRKAVVRKSICMNCSPASAMQH